MSYDMLGTKDDFCLNSFAWATLHSLALSQGWEPMGARRPVEIAEYYGVNNLMKFSRSLCSVKLSLVGIHIY
jgi:hypothetical protein